MTAYQAWKIRLGSRYRFIEISFLEGSYRRLHVVFIAVITRHQSQSSPLPLLLASVWLYVRTPLPPYVGEN